MAREANLFRNAQHPIALETQKTWGRPRILGFLDPKNHILTSTSNLNISSATGSSQTSQTTSYDTAETKTKSVCQVGRRET